MKLAPVAPRATDPLAAYAGLELLSTAVLVIDAEGRVRWVNQAAEAMLDLSRRIVQGQLARGLFAEPGAIDHLLDESLVGAFGMRRQVMLLRRPLREALQVQAIATALYQDETPLLLELSAIEQQLKVNREERQLDMSEASRRLMRNLAHEIKNPLGGIRGAAQLLDTELRTREEREYTGVIISEADRLQALVDRVLASHRAPRVVAELNIHEVCERVRSVMLAEYPNGLLIERDYDASVPEFRGDREQLIQALLNVVRNAAQALRARIAAGDACVQLRTRVAQQVTMIRRPCRLALDLRVIDNGPGIPEELKERVFDPLVSGREGGSGLGLSLAQELIHQNGGTIDFESVPGRTDFRILLPLR
ncbi:MAG TPA: nitrogen regulation protein NR(II) [Burkholderiaceae bacterium]|jgi:two-component system nitrogen regulation sensor histidine kinase GlnL|nr:nitrogen regulation protein NR(II) [Burkholderiaceae bacterium]